MITEAHVRAGAGCLAAVAEAFAKDPALDVATFQFRRRSSTVVGELTERRLERVLEWGRLGWTRLNFTASAVRAEAYARAGGLDSRLNLFAPSYLSARLDEQGAKVTHLESAGVDHELEEGCDKASRCHAVSPMGSASPEGSWMPSSASVTRTRGTLGPRHAYRPEVARRSLRLCLRLCGGTPSVGGRWFGNWPSACRRPSPGTGRGSCGEPRDGCARNRRGDARAPDAGPRAELRHRQRSSGSRGQGPRGSRGPRAATAPLRWSADRSAARWRADRVASLSRRMRVGSSAGPSRWPCCA